MNRTRKLFVGIGSPHGDDQVGWLVAVRLQLAIGPTRDMLIKQAVVPTDVLDWLDGVEHLHLCDACQTGSPLGTLHCWEWPVTSQGCSTDGKRLRELEAIQPAHPSGSHDWPIAQTLRLAARLLILPPRVTIWGIEGCHFAPGGDPGPEIQASVAAVVDEIAASLCRKS